MPLPVVAAALIAAAYWVVIRAAIRSMLVWVWGNKLAIFFAALQGWDYVKDYVEQWWEGSGIKDIIVSQLMQVTAQVVQQRTGVQLDPADPFSVASMSAGVGSKIGIELTDITDRDAVMRDVGKEVAKRINLELGTQFDSVWPVTNFRDQMKNECVLAVQNGMAGGNTFLPVEAINQIKSLVRANDGVFINRTEKRDRERTFARLRYRKFMLTHKRVSGIYVEK